VHFSGLLLIRISKAQTAYRRRKVMANKKAEHYTKGGFVMKIGRIAGKWSSGMVVILVVGRSR
jgi:hypothetical protein